MARRVLVVDDDLLVLETLANMLAELDYDTLMARSANEALGTIAKDETIDILIRRYQYAGIGWNGPSKTCAQLPA